MKYCFEGLERLRGGIVAGILLSLLATSGPAPAAEDSLPSWKEGPAKASIVAFVEEATEEGGAGFVAPADRIAVFDGDGTLWPEQPAYFEVMFAMDRVREMAPDHPGWNETQPFQGVLEEDWAAVSVTGREGMMDLLVATHSGMTNEAFRREVAKWVETAKHPRFGRPYPELAYQPMRELVEYLHENEFRSWIVTGGGIEFMRVWAEATYGIPPEQVIGTQFDLEYVSDPDSPHFLRRRDTFFLDDGPGKPVGILRHIGKRPLVAFGNSDGDLEMLEWTTAGDRAALGVLIHHTDAEREWAYDRDSSYGRLDRGLELAADRAWLIVDMAKDWSRIFAWEEPR